MKRATIRMILFLTAAVFFSCSGPSQTVKKTIPPAFLEQGKRVQEVYAATMQFMDLSKDQKIPGVEMDPYTRIDTLVLDRKKRSLDIYFNNRFAYRPLRESSLESMYRALREELGASYRNYEIRFFSTGVPVEKLIPNYYIPNPEMRDRTKFPVNISKTEPLVRNNSKPYTPSRGLYGRHIALWNSHGWYYENSLDRWEWQRARNFQVVEDIFPTSYVLQYLVPMLENAGANVFLPRERDLNTNEVIVDNDIGGEGYIENGQWEPCGYGWGPSDNPYQSGENPFMMGSARRRLANDHNAYVEYIPDIPKSGEYSVYISYHHNPSNIDNARYTVYHAGGKTDFLVNQQIGGETWIYLGKFQFNAGREGKVIVRANRLSQNKFISTDAVRFGGGMGNIERGGKTSGKPRWVEASRYYLQYAGMPESVYNIHRDTVDYNDDYKCRGEWVNYLKGAPYGPNDERDTPGLGIPLDLSFAFHTDAGTTRNDTVVGTLLIYSRRGGKTDWKDPEKEEELVFPDGQSRYVNRDLADIIQTQIVDDIRSKYDPAWNHRGMWDSGYSEAWRPNVPAVLLELHSHHNFLDMKFGNDPQFRFDVGRSIYKGMLRFLAVQNQQEFVVQPLPPDHVTAEILHGKVIRIKWQPVLDPLEPSAMPQKYVVYSRRDNGGWDDGVLLDGQQCLIPGIADNVIYSFKITAVNDGGESFPSEIVSVCHVPDSPKILIINGFDRVSGPEVLETEQYLGFMDHWGKSVPDKYDLSYTGSQYDFDANSKWLDDDSPGNGASYGDRESEIIVGNTRDYPYIHGLSIRAAGYSFDSASDEAVSAGLVDLEDYRSLDIVYGEQKATPWPKPVAEPRFRVFPVEFAQAVRNFCLQGGNVFLSGAYIGTDLKDDPERREFAENILKYAWRTDYATRGGAVYTQNALLFGKDLDFNFVTEFHPKIYGAENPDGIEAAKNSGAQTVMRYAENNVSAAVAYNGEEYNTVIMGFPFECIEEREYRDMLMKAILDFFENDQDIRQNTPKDGRKKSSLNN
ncbi:MAG: xanthan lyase [Candidatus Neomarinimicrobiota bacterium]|nr:xanthan lyase [Candidatus Neomarinimicrobiota bacterium]MDD3965532.1 xanthan lyase [Candidatus Neomarinimicrobiota bacterium]MDX9780395.1 xanthan lyase [bacterium]